MRMNCLFGKKDIFKTCVKNWVKKEHLLNIKTYKREIILLTLDAFSIEMMKWEYWRLIPMTTIIGERSIQHIKPYIPSYRLKENHTLSFFAERGWGVGVAYIITRNQHCIFISKKRLFLFKCKQCLERCSKKRTRNFELRHFTPTPTVFMMSAQTFVNFQLMPNYVIPFSSIRPFSERI